MKVGIIAAVSAFVIGLTGAAFGQGPVILYNPLSKLPETSHTDADEQIAKEALVPKVRALWNEADGCDGSNLNIIGAVNGSFTRLAAKQRAIVYELCQTGNGFANNGIAVTENGKIAAHFAVAGGWNLEVSKAPDVNANGRDELIIETGGGMHQGYTGSSVTILEIEESAVTEFGTFLAFTNECENHAANKYCDRSYKLTVAAGAKPVFFSQKYTNRGTDEKPRWVAAGKVLPAKTLGDIITKYEAVK